MATIGTKTVSLSISVAIKDGSGNTLETITKTKQGTATAIVYQETTIDKTTADYTLTKGNLVSFADIILLFDAAVDNVFLSTVVGDIEAAVGQSELIIFGLTELAACHIDCTSNASDVDFKALLISYADQNP